MPALVESMFYVREVPWHGLGKQLEEAPNSKEAIIEAGLDWRVDSRPIFDAFGKEIEGFKANTRSTDNSVLGIVSDKYKIVQNEEAFEFTDSLLEEDVHYETAGSLKNGRTVWLLAKMPEAKILDDKFDPYVCFMNTHDGTGAIKVCMTNTRVVCNNTLNLALRTAKRSWSTKHMGDMQSKLAEAKMTLQLANAYNTALSEEADKLANIKISDAQFEHILEEVLPVNYDADSARKIRNITDVRENIMLCYTMPDIAKFRGTAWGVINAVSDHICHSAPSRMTPNYRENNWGKIMVGHPMLDKFYDNLTKVA